MTPRLESKTTQRFIDLGVLSIAFWSAFLLRFEGDLPQQYLKRALLLWPYVTAFQYLAMSVVRVPNFAWRYIGLRDINRIILALAATATVLLSVRLTASAFWNINGYAQFIMIPISVILMDFALAFMGICGVRVLRRLLFERNEHDRRRQQATLAAVPTLLIGAGRAGVAVAREIAHRPDLGILAVGFIDDDKAKRGQVIHGLKILGSSREIQGVRYDTDAEQAIITIANAPGKQIRRLKNECEKAGLQVKIIPGLYELLDGSVNLTRLREVSIEDLLRREVVELDNNAVANLIMDKRVLVTGAGGSIGSEICRQVARLGASQIALVDRAEPHLFAIHLELERHYPHLLQRPCLTDVGDAEQIDRLFSSFKPQVVFHAAAHKHVPMVEWNPVEAVKNNVFGTACLADAAHRHNTNTFVLISTDKAVNPTSLMGATKRIAEVYTQALSQESDTNFVAVRFGNVLGSTGSVVPIFKAQIERGGPVTVTHPDMQRYFMTIPEATLLVVEAAALGEGDEVFLLDMGEPVKIVDLATDLIRLSGLEPHEDIQITFSGVRPGEKLFEELCFDPTKMTRTRNDKIFRVTSEPESMQRVKAHLQTLHRAVSTSHRDQWRDVMRSIVPEMQDDARVQADAASETSIEEKMAPTPAHLQKALG